MFEVGHLPPKSAVNISPPIPEEYEIRVIIWNTENVPLVDSHFLTGEKCCDIYVKGYINVNIDTISRRSDAFRRLRSKVNSKKISSRKKRVTYRNSCRKSRLK